MHINKLNKINNAKFIEGDAKELLPQMIDNNESFKLFYSIIWVR